MLCDVIETPPLGNRWDFGGYPYGLEPLALPLTASEPAVSDVLGKQLDAHQRVLAPPGEPLVPDPVERLFWFRWITGHQATFILWQLLARAMKDPAAATQERCRVFVRGYSAMLLYTGSCPRSIYLQLIRPSMVLQHPGFSGAWARDFQPVRALLGTHALSNSPDTPLGRECALNGIIHKGVASKLVPDGKSLFQAMGTQRMSWRRSILATLYDNYFLTQRAAVPYQTVVRQMLRRLHAIGLDIAGNGLYPAYASSEEEKPASLETSQVASCERTILETLFAIAVEAIGRPARKV